MTDTPITDKDLLDKLEEFRASRHFAMMERQLSKQQEERNRAKAEDEERERERAQMTIMERRRSAVRYVLENEANSPANLQYMHSSLAICGLPFRRPAEGVTEFERKQGRMSVVVEAGKVRAPDGSRVQQPLPWGPKPRLILAYLSGKAIRSKSPVIDTADSLTEFMRELGFERRGGERGNIAPFKEQLQALAACRMEISAWDGSRRSATIDSKPFRSMELWLSENSADKSLWPSRITFSQDFFQSLTKHAVPLDTRALHAFANSAKKLDLYFWLVYRLHNIKAPVQLSWANLQEQFGDSLMRPRDFRSGLANDIEHIRSVFPRLPVKLDENGLRLEAADLDALHIPVRKRLAR